MLNHGTVTKSCSILSIEDISFLKKGKPVVCSFVVSKKYCLSIFSISIFKSVLPQATVAESHNSVGSILDLRTGGRRFSLQLCQH